MQISVDLQNPFSYSIWLTIIILIVLLSFVYYLVLLIIGNINKNKQKVIVKPEEPKKSLSQIKKQYLEELDILTNKVTQNEISVRKAYQSLSKIIRNFVFEVTGIEVQKLTLAEIKKINIPSLTELIEEYYPPAFSLLTEGNIKNSLNKTGEVIKRWN